MRFDGEKVHSARLMLAHGLDTAAEQAGVSKNSWVRAERGEDIRPSTARKIAAALRLRVADLLKEDPDGPLAEALASQEPLFDGASERERFVERVRRYIEARVAHYEQRLAEAKQGGVLVGYEGARHLLDDATAEFMHLPNLINDEMADRWMLNPEIPDHVKEDLGRAVGEAMQPFVDVVGRIATREKELAETEAQKQETERRIRELTERISA